MNRLFTRLANYESLIRRVMAAIFEPNVQSDSPQRGLMSTATAEITQRKLQWAIEDLMLFTAAHDPDCALDEESAATVFHDARAATIVCGADPALIAWLFAVDPDLISIEAHLLRLAEPASRADYLAALLRHREWQEGVEEVAALDSECVMTVEYADGAASWFGSSHLESEFGVNALVLLGYEPVRSVILYPVMFWLFQRQRPRPFFFEGSSADDGLALWEASREWYDSGDADLYWADKVKALKEAGEHIDASICPTDEGAAV